MALPASFRSYEIQGFGDCETTPKLNASTALPVLSPSQVLVRVVSAATNPADVMVMEMPMVSRTLLPSEPTAATPLRIGFDFAGTLAQVGSAAASSFSVGDEVFGFVLFNAMGTFAEYVAVEAAAVAKKPATLTFDEAAAVPVVACTSYQSLVDTAALQKSERVLILGGSGGTGSAGIQIAKALGAFVIATTSARNVELVKSFGADEVIDYTSQNWSEELAPGSIDVIYDCGAEPMAWNTGAQKVLKPQTGRFVTIGHVVDPIESPIGARCEHVYANPNVGTLKPLSALIESGKLTVPIDSVFPFEQLSEALAKQKTKRARGKIILQVEAPSNK